MKKVLKAIKTIPYSSGFVKVFFKEVEAGNLNNLKRLNKENIGYTAFGGIWDKTGSIRQGDYFVIEG